MKNKGVLILLLTVSFFCYGASGQSLKDRRAQFNYQVSCRGCHLPDASGIEGRVPRIKGFVGNFLKVKGGREFLVRVPGAANAALDDKQLAELLNWMIVRFAGASLPDNFKPYTTAEVAKFRSHPLIDVIGVRARLVKSMQSMARK